MTWTERVSWLMLGCFIGFSLGYIVRSLREIKEEVDEIDGIVKEKRRHRRADDAGFSRYPLMWDVVLLVVVVLTAWGAFASVQASNKTEDTQEELQATQKQVAVVTSCNQEFLSKTIRALNYRTESTQARAEANVELQKAQADFFALLLRKPPESETTRTQAGREYLTSLQNFVEVSEKTDISVEKFPYPTNEELSECLNQ